VILLTFIVDEHEEYILTNYQNTRNTRVAVDYFTQCMDLDLKFESEDFLHVFLDKQLDKHIGKIL
jgi:hypothetical protein